MKACITIGWCRKQGQVQGCTDGTWPGTALCNQLRHLPRESWVVTVSSWAWGLRDHHTPATFRLGSSSVMALAHVLGCTEGWFKLMQDINA